MIDSGLSDRAGRRVTLREVDDANWRAIADVAPRDDQRDHVAALAARYLLLSLREDVWHSLGIYADEQVVGHIMWGADDDAHWVGGMVVDASQQGRGLGRAAMRTMLDWLAARDDCRAIRLDYAPDNHSARRLYESLGFVAVDTDDDGAIIAEFVPD